MKTFLPTLILAIGCGINAVQAGRLRSYNAEEETSLLRGRMLQTAMSLSTIDAQPLKGAEWTDDYYDHSHKSKKGAWKKSPKVKSPKVKSPSKKKSSDDYYYDVPSKIDKLIELKAQLLQFVLVAGGIATPAEVENMTLDQLLGMVAVALQGSLPTDEEGSRLLKDVAEGVGMDMDTVTDLLKEMLQDMI